MKSKGLIVAQLWHVGRVSHPDLLNGDTPVSASAVQQGGLRQSASPNA